MTELAFVFGTRSEAVRLAPVIRACERRGVEHAVIRVSKRRTGAFGRAALDQFDVDPPDIELNVGSGSDGEQTGAMLVEIERALSAVAPSVAVVQGDANSALAGAIAASKMETAVAHVDAGLRSFDRTTPEETNRVVADRVADYLFVATEKSRRNLVRKGISELRITVAGSTAVDAVEDVLRGGRRETAAFDDLGLAANEFALVAVHNPENVDDPDRFRSVLEGAARAGDAHGLEVVYPVHPRARERLERFDLDVPAEIRPIAPQRYTEFLRLVSTSATVVTDSGSVQEEACILGVPCVTVRNRTERSETIEQGANRLSGCGLESVSRRVTEALESNAEWEIPYRDGDAAERILGALPVSAEREEIAP